MMDRLKNWLSGSGASRGDEPGQERRATQTPHAREELHAFARWKIEHWLTQAGYAALLERLELAYEEKARVLYQALPIRVYVYDLETPAGELEFELACGAERPPNTVIETAAVLKAGKKLGYYLYSLQQLKGVPVFGDGDAPPFDSYRVADDWARLLDYSKDHDLAYRIPWLRRLYGEAVLSVTKMLSGERPSMEVAHGMVYLNDATLHEWLDRLKADLAGKEGAEAFGTLVDAYVQATQGGPERNKPLRENPLIAALFAFDSPLFHSINAESFDELCRSSFEHLRIAAADIDVCTQFFNYVHDHNAEAAREVARVCYSSAKGSGEKELLAYAASNMAVHLTTSDDPEELKLAVQYYKEARTLFSSIDPQHSALSVLQINLKRVTGRLVRMGRPEPAAVTKPEHGERLRDYNEKVGAGDFAEGLKILDEVIADVDRGQPLWVDLNAQAGQILLSQGRVDDAYGRLYRCENAVRNGVTSETCYYESFKSHLQLRSGEADASIKTAEEAINRLGHLCSLKILRSLIVTLSAAYCEAGRPDDAVALIQKHEPAFWLEEDQVYMKANLAFAYLVKHDFEQTVTLCEEALASPKADTYKRDVTFDILQHMASAKLHLFEEKKTDFQSTLEVFERLEEYLPDVHDTKRNFFYRDKARLLEIQGQVAGGATELFERGFAAAEKALHDIARQPGDINDRVRLLSGLKSKVTSFPSYSRLFDLYAGGREWAKLYAFCQRFKATFLIEAYFSNSENLIARKGAKWLAESMNAGKSDALDQLYLFSLVIEAGGPGRLREFLREYLVKEGMVEGSGIVLPISVEHLDPAVAFSAAENLQRGEEVNRATTLQFLESQLGPAVAVVEFFPLGEDSVGALVVQKGAEPQFIGPYERPEGINLPTLFEHERLDARALESNSASFQSAFGQLGAELRGALREDIEQVVLCPTSWANNLPFHALRVGGGESIGDLYRCVYNASATLYALSLARSREKCSSGVGFIDPRSELFYSEQEAAALDANTLVKFGRVVRSPLTWEEFKKTADGAHWLHISAHGYRDTRYFGLLSGLETGPGSGDPGAGPSAFRESEDDLTALAAFIDYFPGLDASVVVLSSCYAGEVSSLADEPVGVPTALLTGGAKAVVAPMWKVDEFSAVLFMEFFYGELGRAATVAAAIQGAQDSLRDVSTSEVLAKLEGVLAGKVSSKDRVETYQNFIKENFEPEACPYSDPYHWAAFSLIGCDVQLR